MKLVLSRSDLISDESLIDHGYFECKNKNKYEKNKRASLLVMGPPVQEVMAHAAPHGSRRRRKYFRELKLWPVEVGGRPWSGREWTCIFARNE